MNPHPPPLTPFLPIQNYYEEANAALVGGGKGKAPVPDTPEVPAGDSSEGEGRGARTRRPHRISSPDAAAIAHLDPNGAHTSRQAAQLAALQEEAEAVEAVLALGQLQGAGGGRGRGQGQGRGMADGAANQGAPYSRRSARISHAKGRGE